MLYTYHTVLFDLVFYNSRYVTLDRTQKPIAEVTIAYWKIIIFAVFLAEQQITARPSKSLTGEVRTAVLSGAHRSGLKFGPDCRY